MKLFWRKNSEEVKRARMKEQNDTLKSMTSQLEKLNNLLENGALGKMAINTDGQTICSYVDSLEARMRTNTVSPDRMEEYVGEEILYHKEYDKQWNRNPDLVEFIEKYCKFENKYEAVELFKELDRKYEIKKRG